MSNTYNLEPQSAGQSPASPVVASQNQNGGGWLSPSSLMMVINVGVLAFVLWKSGSGPAPQPVPPNPPQPDVVIVEDVEKLTAEAERKFIKNKAEAAERLASEVESKKIQNSNQFAKIATEYQDAIERDAFEAMIGLNQKYIRESDKDGWSDKQRESIVSLQKRKAAGYRSLLK